MSSYASKTRIHQMMANIGHDLEDKENYNINESDSDSFFFINSILENLLTAVIDTVCLNESSRQSKFNQQMLLRCDESDFSSGSGEEFIPGTDESTDSELTRGGKRIKLHSFFRPKKSLNSTNIIIDESDTASGVETESQPRPECSFWDNSGVDKKGKKKKYRKALHERRSERDYRKNQRNSGKRYTTLSGKIVKEKILLPLPKCRMGCSDRIPHSIREYTFNEYWKLGSYDDRAKYVEKFITLQNKKSCKITVAAKSNRKYSNSYRLTYFTEEYKIRRGCLEKTLNESFRFLQTICEKLHKYGYVTKSERGRASSYKKISDDKLEEVKLNILKFPTHESHYSRARSTRKYLSSDLSIQKMYELYAADTENPVSKTVFIIVFDGMNLSFKKPRIDTCNKCGLLENKIKYLTDAVEIELVQQELEKHELDWKNAYEEKRIDKERAKVESEETCVIAFDLQQCLPTPLLNISSVFYKRQLWVYNLTIHDFKTNIAYCYMWPESSGARGANQISSCLYNFITIHLPVLHPQAKYLVMYSDCCSGQNRNSIVTSMLLLAIKQSDQLISIEHKFLVPGHTHMEVDSDHALIERAKKKTSMSIHHPRDWCQLVRTASTRSNKFSVIEMQYDDFYNFAEFSKKYLTIKKNNVKGDKFIWSDIRTLKYNNDSFPNFLYKYDFKSTEFEEMSYAKRGKIYSALNFNAVPRCYNSPLPISKEKKKDLISLLPYIDPAVHEYYKNLLAEEDQSNIDPDIELLSD